MKLSFNVFALSVASWNLCVLDVVDSVFKVYPNTLIRDVPEHALRTTREQSLFIEGQRISPLTVNTSVICDVLAPELCYRYMYGIDVRVNK